ncbi:nicotinamide/nicotinic acid mononucleotide adenylyltransferase 2 [Trichomonascus vanleenenianus]|uniref:nicotinamide-nucleotide adenylyltransferase NMA2 n=1 Tax=Trichomonascus vanleenenianus TaxID=2268995 RepID=UPI003ECABC6D
MDPTLAPDFIPPSEQKEHQKQSRRQQISTQIPNFSPIQPYVLEDYDDSSIDYPVKREAQKKTKTDPISPSDIPVDIPRSRSAMSAEVSPTASPPLAEPVSRKPSVPPPGSAGQTPYTADLEEVPSGVVRQAKSLDSYEFPSHRLQPSLCDDAKSPLVLVACGSFSPITYLHLRMFEMAMDQIREHTRFEVIGGYYSPVSDNYKKPGLAPAHHRVRMCELACERTSSWLMVDAWESLQPQYTRTALVLDHFNEEINVKRGGVETASGKRKGVKIMLLAGGDLIESMGEPNVWAEDDLHHILGRYGCLIVERTGSDVRSFLLSHDIMYEHRRNIMVIKQLIYNDISSTKVRLFIRRGMSVQYLLPNSVIRYVVEHGLYLESEPVKQVLSERGD